MVSAKKKKTKPGKAAIKPKGKSPKMTPSKKGPAPAKSKSNTVAAKAKAKPVKKIRSEEKSKPAKKPTGKQVKKPVAAPVKKTAEKSLHSAGKAAPVKAVKVVKAVAAAHATGKSAAKVKPAVKTASKPTAAPAVKEKAQGKSSAANAAKPAGKTPVKKPGKLVFMEVAVGAERIIKRGDKTSALPAPLDMQNRRRGGGSEESPEELVERIERELEHQHIFKRNMLRPQVCTKCGFNAVSPRFTIDKELGYCEDCAAILHLGETKEARKIDFHPSLMKKGEEGAPEENEEGDAENPPAVVPDIDL